MKKVYINPKMEIMNLRTHTVILTGSDNLETNNTPVSNDSSDASTFFGSDNEDW